MKIKKDIDTGHYVSIEPSTGKEVRFAIVDRKYYWNSSFLTLSKPKMKKLYKAIGDYLKE